MCTNDLERASQDPDFSKFASYAQCVAARKYCIHSYVLIIQNRIRDETYDLCELTSFLTDVPYNEFSRGRTCIISVLMFENSDVDLERIDVPHTIMS